MIAGMQYTLFMPKWREVGNSTHYLVAQHISLGVSVARIVFDHYNKNSICF